MSEIKLEEFLAEEQKTDDSVLKVLVSTKKPLSVGLHTITLTVVDDAGNSSKPAKIEILVADTQAPTAVLSALDERSGTLKRNENGQYILEYGTAFLLSAEGSLDIPPGKIKTYIWKLVS